ncbi:Integrase catalytic domain-containing protein, partial [Aphis craccivora]
MPVNLTELKVPADISLADSAFHVPKRVDIILGAEIYFQLLTKEQIQTVSRGPIFQRTRLGWVIAGPIPSPTNQAENSTLSLCTSVISEFANVENQIAEFWRLEEIKNCNVYTIEEKRCKQHFELNVTRGEDGRFTVSLPFRDNAPKLRKSYDVALCRMLLLERRFQSDTKLREEYSKFMEEYAELGHKEITQITIPNDKGYYLPHHAVRNERSTSTKLRVVFDASARTSTNVSLNDVLLKGPAVQEDLIWVSESQHDFQCILWREDPSQPLNIYRLKTVTYGVVIASYLVTACLQKLSEEESSKFPEACQALSRDLYVDDFLGGPMSKQSALRLRNDLITILRGAGLELCKWSSNDPNLMIGVEAVPSANNDLDLQYTENVTNILGLYWNKYIDAYQYKVLMYNNKTRPTKRAMLSKIAAIFDPLGLISHVIICFKIIMQKLWRTRVEWDATLPAEIESEWRKCRANLIHLNSLKITRSLVGNGDIADIQLHAFAGASLTAYGACLYLCVKNHNGEVITNLICSKSRVTPLKTISLPRLELLAAVPLVRLSAKYATSLESTRWKTFVAYRIGEIHETTSISQWHHVSTKDNPADIVSRGCCPTKIGELNLWWKVTWLHKDVSDWPKEKYVYSGADQVLLEARTVSHSDEIDKAVDSIIKLVQAINFAGDIKGLRKSGQVNSKSVLLRLRPLPLATFLLFTQQLWARWTRDGLMQLQERTKWMNSSGPKFRVGTVMLMRDDNAPPLKWSMGRVVEVIHGSNEQVRVAKVRTCKGELSRAVRYLCPLPFEGNSPLDH